MSRTVTVVLAVAFCAAFVFAGDYKTEALKLIDQGKAALEADNGQEAVKHLQKAIDLIQKSVAKGFAMFLPKVWDGWTADDPQTNSGNWGAGEDSYTWMQVERRYTRVEDNLRVKVSITSQPQMILGLRASLESMKNPTVREMLVKDPNATYVFIETDDWIGWLKTDKGGRSECVAVHKKVAVTINFSKEDMALLEKMWDAVDRKGIAAANE